MKELEKRLQSIVSNQELAAKLAEKSDSLRNFITSANAEIESERLPATPDELKSLLDKFEGLENEVTSLQVTSKMVSDWCTEISRGPNPSRSVDQAESLIQEQIHETQRGIHSKKSIYSSLLENWTQLETAFDKVETRAENIAQLSVEVKSDSAKSGELEVLLDQSAIEEELETIKDLNATFTDGQIMNEFLEEKVKAVGVKIKEVSAQGHQALKDLQESKSDDEVEKVSVWIQETQSQVATIKTSDELTVLADELQIRANSVSADDPIQEKLVQLDSNIRERSQVIEEQSKIINEIQVNINVLSDMEKLSQSAIDKPAEYQVALNALESLKDSSSLEEYKNLEGLLEKLRYPKGTDERVDSVRQKLAAAEIELTKTEVNSVNLSGESIEEARTSVIQLYQDLVEVKADLEGLIKIKRELQRHNFIAAEGPFSSNLIGLREKFNTVGEDITKTKGTLSKSLRRVQKLKRAVDETDQWAKEVVNCEEQYPPEARQKIAIDAEIRRKEVREAAEDCIHKLEGMVKNHCSQKSQINF